MSEKARPLRDYNEPQVKAQNSSMRVSVRHIDTPITCTASNIKHFEEFAFRYWREIEAVIKSDPVEMVLQVQAVLLILVIGKMIAPLSV